MMPCGSNRFLICRISAIAAGGLENLRQSAQGSFTGHTRFRDAFLMLSLTCRVSAVAATHWLGEHSAQAGGVTGGSPCSSRNANVSHNVAPGQAAVCIKQAASQETQTT